MILGKKIMVPIFILFILFSSMFISLVSIYSMPEKMMGGKGIYVITSSKDKNPIRSNLDIGIAYGLENMSYIHAVSPEIFVFTTINDRAVTVRGAIFDKFLNLENGSIVHGRIPSSDVEAMAGEHAAKVLGLKVGTSLTIYGSFTSSVAVVNIVGIYHTGNPADDEIIVSLPTARKLSGIRSGQVSIIRVKTDDARRVDMLMDPHYPKFKVNLNSTTQVYVGDEFNFTVNIENMGNTPGTAALSVNFQGQFYNSTVHVDKTRKVNLTFRANEQGKYNLTAVVKNDIFYYTCYTQISVMDKPVFITGPTYVYLNTTVNYTFSTVENQSIRTGVLNVSGPGGYERTYPVNGSVNMTFPQVGNYTLIYKGDGYISKRINVGVYGRKELHEMARVYPEPINGTIYIPVGGTLKIETSGHSYIAFGNGSYAEASNFTLPGEMHGNYLLRIRVTEGNYMAEGKFVMHIVENYTPEIISPVKNGTSVVYGENLTFQMSDVVPINAVTYEVNGYVRNVNVAQGFNPEVSNYTYNITVAVNSTRFNALFSFEDVWDRRVFLNVSCPVILKADIIPPEIDVENVTIWSGNRTLVEARDNVEVANISAFFYGHYFNATGPEVYIQTMFRTGSTVEYVPEGKYEVHVVAYDISGNRNETNFTITIDNHFEKNPPVIIGPGFVDLSTGFVLYHAYDNVGVLNITCYEGSTMIKTVWGDTLNITSSDIENGTHELTIEALDVNFNHAYFKVMVVKNYTDTNPPVISVSKLKIWGGNTTSVKATDDVLVKKISVHVFGRYFNGSSAVVVKTKFSNSTGIYFVPPGEYTMVVEAWDIYGNENTSTFTLEINNTHERNLPEFLPNYFGTYNASENITVPSFDNVGIKDMWVEYNGGIIQYSTSGIISFPASKLPCGYSFITIYARDYNGNVNNITMKVMILDDIKPHLLNEQAVMWGGNTTVIRGYDNTRVSFMSVRFFNSYFNSTNGTLLVPTVFKNDTAVKYVPGGIYALNVHILDAYGNENNQTFNLVVDNHDEKRPPVIMGPMFGAVNVTNSLDYRAFDNVAVRAMWIEHNGTVVEEVNSTEILLTNSILPAGWCNVTVYAEDVNGNEANLSVRVYVAGVKGIEVKAALENGTVTTRERGILLVDMTNHNIPGYYNLTVYVDGSLYYSSQLFFKSYERKSVYIYLPYMGEGMHRVVVENTTLMLRVEKSVEEKLPTDLVLKYAKDLKFTESKGVIYKGFQISEGNFILVITALISVTFILLFFGIYSTTTKSVSFGNIGVLRAIGANNRQIFSIFFREAMKYMVLPVVLGIFGGYLLVMGVNYLNLLTAFGHRLIITPTLLDILEVVLIGMIFTIISGVVIFRKLVVTRVVHMMGREDTSRTTTLDELLD